LENYSRTYPTNFTYSNFFLSYNKAVDESKNKNKGVIQMLNIQRMEGCKNELGYS